jgi:hypothetical protein
MSNHYNEDLAGFGAKSGDATRNWPIDPPDQLYFPVVPLQKKTSDGSSTEYYKIPTGATDIIDLIELKNMNFAIGNIFKACFRLGEKANTDRGYDLRKILYFVNRELDRIGEPTTIGTGKG